MLPTRSITSTIHNNLSNLNIKIIQPQLKLWIWAEPKIPIKIKIS